MYKNLNFYQIISISLMLFAMFFGAGNLVFPPFMGYEAGTNFLPALLGFAFTDVGLSVLAIASISLCGSTLTDLAGKVSHKFARILSIFVYLLIGPLFALPRTGSVSFELGILPIISSKGINTIIASLIFTSIFFAVTYIFSLNPSKIVDVIGKVLTPILLITITLIFVKSIIKPIGNIEAPLERYQQLPFLGGLIEGYLALDGLAALAFAIIIINTIKEYGINNKKEVVKYSILCGIIASIGLIIVYGALAYVGATSRNLGSFENGGRILTEATKYLFGQNGTLLFGTTVIFACLTTSIGVTSAFGDYFHEIFPQISYKRITLAVCIFSFVISNFGLTFLIKFTMPILITIYPVVVVLIVLSFFDKLFKGKREVYICSIIATFIVSVIDGFQSINISFGFISNIISTLPLFNFGIGWIIPAIIGAIVGFSPIGQKLFGKAIKSV